jgi:glutamyl-tRNA reductase
MAENVGGSAIRFEDLYDTADQADIVITSTGAPHAIFRREHGELFMHRRKNRPMFFIDIAVPRDVDPEMSQLDGIFVYDMDDLQQVVDSHVSDRGQEAQRAEMLVEEEVLRFQKRMQGLDAVPTIVALQERVEQIRRGEIDRLRGRMGALNPDQQAAIENLTRSIVNKILHQPIAALKNTSGERLSATAELIRNVFGVEEDRSAVAQSSNGAARPPAVSKQTKSGAAADDPVAAEEIAARKSTAIR